MWTHDRFLPHIGSEFLVPFENGHTVVLILADIRIGPPNPVRPSAIPSA